MHGFNVCWHLRLCHFNSQMTMVLPLPYSYPWMRAIWIFLIGGNNFDVANSDFFVFMQKRLDNCGEFSVANFWHNIPQLMAWHK
jgi:hypothetical protein